MTDPAPASPGPSLIQSNPVQSNTVQQTTVQQTTVQQNTVQQNAATPRVTPASQTLRIAATMTGGVSLAIWMGGVAREIDLLCQASTWRAKLTTDDELPPASAQHDSDAGVKLLYLRLLDALDIVADTDVLSGTSAGGINTAFLGYARARGKDLGGLRDVWTRLGSLDLLLRDPRDRSVSSLMYGDSQLWSGVHKALTELPDAADMTRGSTVENLIVPATKLFITTTLLTPETSRFTDSFGTIVQDVDHHGLFVFSDEDFTDGAAGGGLDALALAARSSASFPAAFEPSFVPFSTPRTPASTGLPPRPAMALYANTTRPHWTADGGLLANRPIQPLLESIFDRPTTEGVVRRVLLYIVPSTGDAPNMIHAKPTDSIDAPFGLLDGLLKDLTAVAAQSINSDLQTLQTHNDRVRARSDARLQLAELGTRLPEAEQLLTAQSLADYISREADSVSAPVIDALLRRINSWPSTEDRKSGGTGQSGGQRAAQTAQGQTAGEFIPEGWAGFFDHTPNAEVTCREAVVNGLRKLWGDAPPTTFQQLAAFGRPAYDGAKATLLAVLRDAYVLVQTPADRTWLAGLSVKLHQAMPPPPRFNVQRFVDEQCGTDPTLRALEPPEVAYELTKGYLHRLVCAAAEDPTQVLARAWEALVDVVEPDTHERFAELAARVRPQDHPEVDPPGTDPPALAPPPETPGSLLARRVAAAHHVGTYLDYIGEGQPPLVRAQRLFNLHAAQRAILPVSADLEQPVEFIQVSADTRTLLDPHRRTAQSKLAGMQLYHFGAFYKASWRVNDWMWGRLDGAGWLVHILLDPRRVQLKAQEEAHDGKAIDWFVDLLSAPELAGPIPAKGFPLPLSGDAKQGGATTALTEDAVRHELAYLDDPTMPTPISLPLCALWVARAWQVRIADTELPVLANTVLNGPPPVSAKTRQSIVETRRAALALTKHPAGNDEALDVNPSTVQWATDVARLQASGGGSFTALASCPVPEETFATEVGSSLLTRTATHAAATATAAVGSLNQIPSVVRPIMSSVRTVTLTAYRATTLVDPRPGRLALIGLAALILGLAGAVQNDLWFGIAGTTLVAIGAYLIAIAAWGASRMLLVALLSLLVVGAVGSLALPWVRAALFGVDEKNGGLLGRNIHWIGDAWWHPFLLLGLLVLLPVLAVIAARPTARKKKP